MDNYLYLNWDNYKTSFLHALSTLRSCDKDDYSDATLACDGKFYKVHKIVLSTCSDYFKDIFKITSCKNPVIVLKDLKSDDLEYLLDYMYTGSAHIKQSQIMSLIKAAEGLCIKGLATPDYNKVTAAVKRKRRPRGTSPIKKRKPSVSFSSNINPSNSLPLQTLEATTENATDDKPSVINCADDCSKTVNDLPVPILAQETVPQKPENMDVRQGDIGIEALERFSATGEVEALQPANDIYEEKFAVGDNQLMPPPEMPFDVMTSNILQKSHPMVIPSTSDATLNTGMAPTTSTGQMSMQISPANKSSLGALLNKRPKKKSDHECPYCKKYIIPGYKLKEHIRMHTGEKPYGCPHCPFRCAYKYNTVKHMMNKHDDLSKNPLILFGVSE